MSFMSRLMRMDVMILVIVVGVALYFMLRKPKALSNMFGFNSHPSQTLSKAASKPKVASISAATARQKMGGKAVIAFMSNNCGHCTNMKPDFFSAAASVPSVHWVDTTDDDDARKLVDELGIEGYPSVLYFDKGKKVGEYKGSRDSQSFTGAFKKFLQ